MQCCCPLCSSLHVRPAPPFRMPHLPLPTADRGRLTVERLREAAGATPLPARAAELAVATAEARPTAACATQQAMDKALQQVQVQVQVQQFPAGEGTRATRERRERRVCGGNRRGAVHRRRRGLAMPATVAAAASTAAAPMLSEDSDGNGGAAPWKRPWVGRSEAPGQRRQVAGPMGCSPQRKEAPSTQSWHNWR